MADISVTDPRHKLFLQRNGVTTYNNYFNRDKKRMVVESEFDWPCTKPLRMTDTKCSELSDEYRRRYDIFYYEYRDGVNAVPVPFEMEYHLVEPEQHCLPLDYIKEHGVLEFILETGYPYSVCCLLSYSKAAEYQMIYIDKLIKEGRLTRNGKNIFNLSVTN